MARFNIAIDGTSGVGKSTVADILAEKLKMTHLDTGAMYRCAALAIKNASLDMEDKEALEALLASLVIGFDQGKVLLNGKDVTRAIRTNDISNFTSKISADPLVRARMVRLQQDICKEGGWIADGRDIGTVVLPDAQVKIFLSAKPQARAQRRYDEYMSKNIPADFQTILDDIIARDWNDSHRACSPLRKAEDAVEIDTSELTAQQVAQAVLDVIDGKGV